MGSDLAKARTQQGDLKQRIEQLQLQNQQLKKVKKDESKPKVTQKPTKPVEKQVEQTKPQAASVPIGKDAIIQAIYNKFGHRPEIVALANCESGLNPRAFNPMDYNGTWDAGIFQINGVHGMTPEHWFDVNTNIQKAWELSHGGTHWYPWPTCSYQVGLL